MKLVLQIAAGILLAMLIQWVVADILVPTYFIARTHESAPPKMDVLYVPSYDKDYPCAHMEHGSSVRKWCEANEAKRAAEAAAAAQKTVN